MVYIMLSFPIVNTAVEFITYTHSIQSKTDAAGHVLRRLKAIPTPSPIRHSPQRLAAALQLHAVAIFDSASQIF